jgi:hypothetical protein
MIEKTSKEYTAAAKIIPTDRAMMCLFNVSPGWAHTVLLAEEARDYVVEAVDYGFDVLLPQIKLKIPIPLAAISYLIEIPSLVLMFSDADDYVPSPLVTISLDQKMLEDAKEVFSL